jgi:hypothetical protein
LPAGPSFGNSPFASSPCLVFASSWITSSLEGA